MKANPGLEFDPSWSPDGKHIAFTSNRYGPFSLFLRLAERTVQDELLVDAEPGGIVAPDWSPDGRYLLYPHRGDLWRYDLNERKPYKFRSTDAIENSGVFSPDGRWVAFRSNASGRPEIWVTAFPSGEGEHKVSRDGGFAPRWSSNGRELFFLSPDATLMVARIASTNPFTSTIPEKLFETDLFLTNNNPYAVAKDGRRFLMPVFVDPRNRFAVTIAVNWTSKLPK